jgi:hypothetical protein
MTTPEIKVMDVAVGESVYIDGKRIKITVSKKSGQLARLIFSVPSDVVVERPARNNAATSAARGVVIPQHKP